MDETRRTYITNVPDHHDRIVWRGRYYHLPIEQLATAGQENKAEAASSTDADASASDSSSRRLPNNPASAVPDMATLLRDAERYNKLCRGEMLVGLNLVLGVEMPRDWTGMSIKDAINYMVDQIG